MTTKPKTRKAAAIDPIFAAIWFAELHALAGGRWSDVALARAVREAELLARVCANAIREHHGPGEFPRILARAKSFLPPDCVAALRRALYS
jgi:hypothetical protein